MLPAMPSVMTAQIEVHLFRRRRGRAEFLLLRRSPDRTLGGVWQPITGGIEKGETAWRAAAREVLEETGLRPIRWWALEYLASYYDPARDAVRMVPVFAAEVAWTDTVMLSHEHDRYAFAAPAAAARRVLWGTQRRAMAAVRDEVLAGGAGSAAREITERVAGLRLERPETPARRRASTKPRAPRTRAPH
jgi:dATP pyrophosphohydrolase